MKLFYLTEHTSCYNYFKFIEEGFRYYKFDTGLNHEEKLTKDCILFVVKGSLCISYRGHEMLVREGKMIFFVVTVSLTHIHWNRVKSWRLYLRAGYGHAKRLLSLSCIT